MNDACGKPAKTRGRDLLEDERKRIADREAERAAEERETAERRMAADTLDYERPERYAPSSDEAPMTDRDRRSLREFREEEEAAERERQRPAREAERRAAEERESAEAARRLREDGQRKYWADWIQSDPDPKLTVSDAMRSAKMPTKEAEKFTTEQAAKFAAESEYMAYRTPENADAILGYLHRNGVFIADVETIRAAFVRLRDLGVIKPKPVPAPPQPVQQPQYVNLSVAPTPKASSGPKTYVGRDHATGKERTFTEREVNRMSSIEFQRAFQIAPTVSELFTALGDPR